MRRFMVHLVTEIDFVDGDEASDEAAQNYQKHLSDTLRNAAQGSRFGRSRTPGSRASRSQKSRMNSNARLRAYDARQHALARRSLRHRGVRQLRTLDRRQRRPAAETLIVPKVDKRLRCSHCGGETISTRPAWHTSPRQSVRDYRRERPPMP